MSERERLLTDLGSSDWQTAVDAAWALRAYRDPAVTHALIAALDSYNTAITEVAMQSLLTRDEPHTIEPLWNALLALGADVIDHAWDPIEYDGLRDSAIAQEMRRRDAMTR